MNDAYLNRLACVVPPHEVNGFYLRFAASMLADERRRTLFGRMTERAGITHRYSCFAPGEDPEGPALDAAGLFRRGDFPGTGARMALYAQAAPELAATAVDRLLGEEDRDSVTHLIVASCTGFYAPGIDLDILARCGLRSSVERTIVGFMGCYAAVNALKLARHIVRSEPAARVLVVAVEICTLHLKETDDLETLLSFCLWGDGAAAALVTNQRQGMRLERFDAFVAPEARDMMRWTIEDDGFDMVLSGEVPLAIFRMLDTASGGAGGLSAIDLWAVHPGGRSVLDAVGRGLDLSTQNLEASRSVLDRFGNMSSATILFVLETMLAGARPGQAGLAMAFGPGLTAETMRFTTV